MEPKISPYQQQLINWAILSLAESLSERSEVRAINNKVIRAKGYLEEFNSSLQPNEVTLTEGESALSGFLHTMLRKGEDSGASSILYRMVNKDQGKNVWRKFIKTSLSDDGIGNLESDNFEDVVMHFLLYDWGASSSFIQHMETFIESQKS